MIPPRPWARVISTIWTAFPHHLLPGMLLDIFDVTLWQIARSNHAVAEIFDAICQIAAALATPGCIDGAFVSVILAIPSVIILEFLMLTLKGVEFIV
jgi:hypothetical protein